MSRTNGLWNKNSLLYLASETLKAHKVINSMGEAQKIFKLVSQNRIEDIPDRFQHLVDRRAQGEPFAYLKQQKEFYGRDFYVDRATLIPRPETELLVDSVLEFFENTSYLPESIIELGVGSGAVITSILAEIRERFPNIWNSKIRVTGTDISKEALQVASRNAKVHDVHQKIEFIIRFKIYLNVFCFFIRLITQACPTVIG